MQKVFLYLCLLVCSITLNAQVSKTNYFFDSTALNNIRNFYSSERGSESAIYNGKLHYPYASNIEGVAYFNSEAWQKGSVIYDNTLYENILMKYDLVQDQLIIIAYEKTGLPIALFSPRIKEFSLPAFRFVYLDEKKNGSILPPGFYQLLLEGRITVFSRNIKVVSEKIEGLQLFRRFEEKNAFYILKDGQYYLIKTKKDLLTTLEEHKKEINSHLKKMKLNFRNDPMRSLISAAELYNRQPN